MHGGRYGCFFLRSLSGEALQRSSATDDDPSGKNSGPSAAADRAHMAQQYRFQTHNRSVLVFNHYNMDDNSPTAIQFHSRQGRPATRSHPSPALITTLGLLHGKVDPLVQRPGPGTGFTRPKVFVIQSLFKPVFSCRHKRSTALDFQRRCSSLRGCTSDGFLQPAHATAAGAKSVCGQRWAHDCKV